MRDTKQTERPSIVEVVSRYVSLRRAGKEFTGLCPFRSEKTPSFTVNEDKGVFHCFGCGEGGDVFDFVMKIEGTDFKGALSVLGLADGPAPPREEIKKRDMVRQASQNLASWALSVSALIGERMREAGQRAHMARKVIKELPGADTELLEGEIERATREWAILDTLEEELLDPVQTATFWQEREEIERLVGGAA